MGIFSRPKPSEIEFSSLPASAGKFRRFIAKPRTFFFQNSQNLEICKAIEDHNLESVKNLTQSGHDLNMQEKGGMTVLFWAFMQDNIEAFEWLLECGSNPDLKLDFDDTLVDAFVGRLVVGRPLPPTYPYSTEDFWYGSESVLFAIVMRYDIRHRFLEPALKRTQSPSQRDVTGGTLFHRFSAFPPTNGNDAIELLIKYKVDINATNNLGETAAISSLRYPGLCLLLLENLADPFIKDKRGNDLLFYVDKDLESRAGQAVKPLLSAVSTQDIKDWLMTRKP